MKNTYGNDIYGKDIMKNTYGNDTYGKDIMKHTHGNNIYGKDIMKNSYGNDIYSKDIMKNTHGNDKIKTFIEMTKKKRKKKDIYRNDTFLCNWKKNSISSTTDERI